MSVLLNWPTKSGRGYIVAGKWRSKIDLLLKIHWPWPRYRGGRSLEVIHTENAFGTPKVTVEWRGPFKLVTAAKTSYTVMWGQASVSFGRVRHLTIEAAPWRAPPLPSHGVHTLHFFTRDPVSGAGRRVCLAPAEQAMRPKPPRSTFHHYLSESVHSVMDHLKSIKHQEQHSWSQCQVIYVPSPRRELK